MARRAATCARAAPSSLLSTWYCRSSLGLIEQIDRDQPVREPPDHFVAARPDRRQFTILVETSRARSTGGRVVALRAQKQLRGTAPPPHPELAAMARNWVAAWSRSVPPQRIRSS